MFEQGVRADLSHGRGGERRSPRKNVDAFRVVQASLRLVPSGHGIAHTGREVAFRGGGHDAGVHDNKGGTLGDELEV